MSTKSLRIQNHDLVTGYDSVAATSWCTPKLLGCNACISANAQGGEVTISISLNTPLGAYTKAFSFNSNVCFTWNPISSVSVPICISNLSVKSTEICFSLSIKICVSTWIKNFCTSDYSTDFCVPLPGNALHEKLASGEINEEQFVHILLLSHHIKDEGECNCK
jgi:hypothetical protein